MSAKERTSWQRVFFSQCFRNASEKSSPFTRFNPWAGTVVSHTCGFPKANCRNVGLEGFANEGYNLRTLELEHSTMGVGQMELRFNRLFNGSWEETHFLTMDHGDLSFLSCRGGWNLRISEANPAGRFHFKSFLACTVFVWYKCFGGLKKETCPARHRFLLPNMFWGGRDYFVLRRVVQRLAAYWAWFLQSRRFHARFLGIERKGKVHFLVLWVCQMLKGSHGFASNFLNSSEMSLRSRSCRIWVAFCNQFPVSTFHCSFKFMQPRKEIPSSWNGKDFPILFVARSHPPLSAVERFVAETLLPSRPRMDGMFI